jgi:hypothetical protein
MGYLQLHVIVGDEWAIGRGSEFVERSSHTQLNQAFVAYYYDYFGAGPASTVERTLTSLYPQGPATGSSWDGIEHTLGARLGAFAALNTNNANTVIPGILKVASNGATIDNMKPGGTVYERLLADVEHFVKLAKSSLDYDVYVRSVTVMAGAHASKTSRAVADAFIQNIDTVLVGLRSVPWFAGADFYVFAPHPNMGDRSPFTFAKEVREAAIWAASRNEATVLDGAFFDVRYSAVAPEVSLNGNAYHDLGHHLGNLIHGTQSERNYTHKPDLSYGYKVWSDSSVGAPSAAAYDALVSTAIGNVGRDDPRNRRSIVARAGRGRNDEIVGQIRRWYSLKPITGDRLQRFWPEDEVLEQLLVQTNGGNNYYSDFRADYQGIWPPGIGPVSSPMDVCFFDGEWFPFAGQNVYMDEIAVAPRVVSWVRADLVTTAAQKKSGNIAAFNDLAIAKYGAPNDTIRNWTPQGSIQVRRHKFLKDQWAFVFDASSDRLQSTQLTHPSGGERGFHMFLVLTVPLGPITNRYLAGTMDPAGGVNNGMVGYFDAAGAIASGITTSAGVLSSYVPTGIASPRIPGPDCYIVELTWSAALNYKTIARVNGSQVWDAGDVTPNAPGTFGRRTDMQWFVGNSATFANGFIGSIAEWVIYEGHLSWRQRMGVLAYMWERYGARIDTFS